MQQGIEASETTSDLNEARISMLERQRDGYYNILQSYMKKSSKKMNNYQRVNKMLLKCIGGVAKAFSLVRKELQLTLKCLRKKKERRIGEDLLDSSKAKLERLIHMIDDYSGVLSRNQEFSITLKRAKDKLQSVINLINFPKSQEEFDQILDFLNSFDMMDKDTLKATLHFENPYKSMSMDLDSSILNCSLLDVSHNPLKSEDPSITTCDSINGISESALLENIKNVNIVLSHADSPPSEEFIESFVSVLLDSPIIKKKKSSFRYGEKIEELENLLRSFGKIDILKKKEPLRMMKKNVLEGIAEVDEEEPEVNKKEISPLDRAFINDDEEPSLQISGIEHETHDKKFVKGSPMIKNQIFTESLMEEESPFEIFKRRLVQLKKKFELCKELDMKKTKKNEKYVEAVEDLSTHFIHFTLTDSINLGLFISEFFEENKEKNPEIKNNYLVKLSELMTVKLRNLALVIEEKMKNVGLIEELNAEFGDISQIIETQPDEEKKEEIEVKKFVKAISEKELEKTQKEKIEDEVEEKEDEIQIGVFNFKKDNLLQNPEMSLSMINRQASLSSEDTEFQRQVSIGSPKIPTSFIPTDNFDLNKPRIGSPTLPKNFIATEKMEERVEKIAENLYNSEILKPLNQSCEEIQSDPLEYSRILSNSMFLDDNNYRAQKVNPLNESIATVATSDPSKMRIYNYFWTPRYLRTGVSSFPYDQGNVGGEDEGEGNDGYWL